MTRPPAQALRAGTLLVWGSVLGWLWLSGHAANYIGSRTSWVVPFGTVALLACGAAALLATRTRTGGDATAAAGDWWGSALLVSPIVAVLLIPSPQLGASAAHRKASAMQARAQIARVHSSPGRPITLMEIVGGNVDPDTRAQVGAREGREAGIDGVVTKVTRDRIDVTRFQIYCCAADAIPFTVTVRGRRLDKHFKLNQWVAVKGRLHDSGGHIYEIAASGVRRARKPADPYL
jgi:uncharacterized repeat protein (TIGR03943 family)